MDIKVSTAKSGFCVGIRQAYQGLDRLATKGGTVHAIHECTTPHKNKEWDALHRIEDGDPELIKRYPNLPALDLPHDYTTLGKGQKVVIGYHGVEKEIKQMLLDKGTDLVDLQCPYIAGMNKTVERLAAEGFDIIAFGKPDNHHCLYAKRLALMNQRRCLIAEDFGDIRTEVEKPGGKWACVGQVTGNSLKWTAFIAEIKDCAVEVVVEQTVCSDTFERQEEAVRLSRESDVVVVVDDGGGSSKSVVEVCQSANAKTFRTGTNMPLMREWFEGALSVAVVGGILVPQWVIEDTARQIQEMAVAV